MTHRTVRDVMTPDVASVGVQDTFKAVIDLLWSRRIIAAPVLDTAGRVVGVVSEADLLPRLEVKAGTWTQRLLRRRHVELVSPPATVGAVMSTPAVTIGPDDSIVEAAHVMTREHVKRLPVVDRDGALVGIVSRRDLLAVFVQPDEEIRTEILENVFYRVLWIGATEMSVVVTGGVVTLAGELEKKGLVDVAVRLCRATSGVVDVVNQLTYRIDDSRIPRSG